LLGQLKVALLESWKERLHTPALVGSARSGVFTMTDEQSESHPARGRRALGITNSAHPAVATAKAMLRDEPRGRPPGALVPVLPDPPLGNAPQETGQTAATPPAGEATAPP